MSDQPDSPKPPDSVYVAIADYESIASGASPVPIVLYVSSNRDDTADWLESVEAIGGNPRIERYVSESRIRELADTLYPHDEGAARAVRMLLEEPQS